jgi:hypothetical protein
VQVATWGMFPRPPDISKAYGGGRTLKPGQELESEDDRAARARRVTEVPPAPRTFCPHGRRDGRLADHWRACSKRVAVRSWCCSDTCMCSGQHCDPMPPKATRAVPRQLGCSDVESHCVIIGAQAVKRYKQSTGLEVEPAVQAQAQVCPDVLLVISCSDLLCNLGGRS